MRLKGRAEKDSFVPRYDTEDDRIELVARSWRYLTKANLDIQNNPKKQNPKKRPVITQYATELVVDSKGFDNPKKHNPKRRPVINQYAIGLVEDPRELAHLNTARARRHASVRRVGLAYPIKQNTSKMIATDDLTIRFNFRSIDTGLTKGIEVIGGHRRPVKLNTSNAFNPADINFSNAGYDIDIGEVVSFDQLELVKEENAEYLHLLWGAASVANYWTSRHIIK